MKMRNKKDWAVILSNIFVIIVATIWLLAMVFALNSCKNTQSVVKEQVHWVDSVRYQVVEQVDTQVVVVWETKYYEDYTENENNTHIIFGDDGGTYDPNSGYATNVKSVSVSNSLKEYQKQTEELQAELTSISKERDSLKSELSKYDGTYEEDKTSTVNEPSFYKRFFWWMFGIALAAILGFVGYFVFTKTSCGKAAWAAIKAFLHI